MKKLLLTIILAMFLAVALGGVITYAASNPVTPALIPKPDLLPGPDEFRIMEEGDGLERNILLDTILPFYTVGLIGFIGGLSLVFLVVGAVRFTTAYGDDESIKKAKDQIVYSLIALVLALLSYTLVQIIVNIDYEGDTRNTFIETIT